MMKLPMKAIVQLVLLSAALGLAMPGTAPAQDCEQVQLVSLEKVLKHPDSFRSMTTAFIVQFHEVGKFEAPVFTKFERDWYLNFSAWPEGASLWTAEAFRGDYPYFFIPRLAAASNDLLNAPIFSRWILTARVAEVIKGQPWIEIEGIERLPPQLDIETVRRLHHAIQKRDQGDFNGAAALFHLCHYETLPVSVRMMALVEEAKALHRAGRSAEAVTVLLDADKVVENDPSVIEALTECRGAMGLDADGHPLPLPEGTGIGHAAPASATEPAPAGTEIVVSSSAESAPTSRPAPKVTLQLEPSGERK